MLCIFITLFALILGGCGSSDDGGDPFPAYTCYEAPETNECTDNPDFPRDCVEVCGSLSCNFYCSATDACYDTEDEAITACGDDACYTCGDSGDDDQL